LKQRSIFETIVFLETIKKSTANQSFVVEPLLLGLKLSKFNFELSKAEASLCFKAYFETELLLCVEDFCLFKINGTSSEVLNCLRRLAFVKEAYVFSKTSGFEALAKLFGLKHGLDSSFKVEVINSQSDENRLTLIDNIASKVLDSGFIR
jgi:hypothetical protein